MTEEEKKAIERMQEVKAKNVHTFVNELDIVLNLIQSQQKEIEKKDKLEKEVADDIDEVARELDKLSNNIFIVNQAMKLQKIAKEKLGKFYID